MKGLQALVDVRTRAIADYTSPSILIHTHDNPTNKSYQTAWLAVAFL